MRDNNSINQPALLYFYWSFILQKLVKANSVKVMLGLMLAYFTAGHAAAQNGSLPNVLAEFKEFSKQAVSEKIFLHLDRPSYVCGDVMWFKVYNVDGTYHHPFDLSKVAYVEVLDADNIPVQQAKVALKNGSGSGSFVLPVSLKSGNYKVRAYTNWMKNFSPNFYFEQPVTVINTFQKLGLKPLDDTAAYAIQFFPEGGSLINGIPAKVAFKATNTKTGKGVGFQGKLIDKAGNEITSFSPTMLGIGNFVFTPSATEEYTAILQYAGGKVTRQKLPAIQGDGYSVQFTESKPGELLITAQATYQQPEQIFLLGHTRQQVTVAATAIMANGKAFFSVQKDSLPAGITHFTVFNGVRKPVSERLYFTRPKQQLEIEATLSNTQFGAREKVIASLSAEVTAGTAVAANLSMAVFRADSLEATDLADIKSYLWLNSDLKGTVENAASYFNLTDPQAEEAFDNLMLTHGWSRFKWDDVLSSEPLKLPHLPEFNGHLIYGKVTHKNTGRPAVGIRTYLSSPSRSIRFYNSISTESGSVLFDVKDFYGTKEVVVQTNFLRDSTYHLQLLSPFSEKYTAVQLPFFNLSETLGNAVSHRHLDVQAQNIYFESYLNRFNAPVTDTIPFYGRPNQQYFQDDYIRFKTMEEVMREYVSGVMVRARRDGFHFRVMNRQHDLFFEDNPLVLLDGVPVFDINKIMGFDPLKIQKLDVMTSNYYTGTMASNGVVSYTTYKGDLAGFQIDTRALLQEYEGLQLQREFYAPIYETEAQRLSRLPDLRNLLYWNSTLHTDKDGKTSVEFFTADLPGTFTVVVQGLTKNGLPGSKTFTFQVKKPL
ncbi:hypothetical protein [Rufibacter roseus]|uniref:MG2 domain-containing protein n=1 Tax=Rufibacter roseus TaxID=1567108 RepID=A0ABW2DQ91_9BACT|nr:hypothetical protein [Rufibacter roseus]